MRRHIPIIRDDIHGIFDQDISGKLCLVSMRPTQMTRMLLEVIEMLTKVEHREGVVLSYDRPSSYIRTLLRKFWIPSERLSFVDGATRLATNNEDDPELDNTTVLEDPFDIGRLLEVLRDLAKATVKERIAPVSRSMEDILVEAELGLLGKDGTEWSMMRHRLRERLSLRTKKIANIPEDETLRTDGSGLGYGNISYQYDYLLIENLSVMMLYLSEDDVNELIKVLKSFIAEGLFRTVIIFVDSNQAKWTSSVLKVRPDIRFGLETNSYMGVIGYRFVPYDNGPG